MPEFNEINADGDGGKGKGDIGTFLIGLASAAAAAAVLAIGKSLFGDRSVINVVSNQTGGALAKISDAHESGGFDTLPKLEIPPLSVDTFSSHSTSPIEGAIGSVTYAGDGITLLVDWHNPRVGENHTAHVLDGNNKSRFLVTRETGSGNEKAQNIYVIAVHPTYNVRSSLSQLGDIGRGIRAFAPPGSEISVRALVNF